MKKHHVSLIELPAKRSNFNHNHADGSKDGYSPVCRQVKQNCFTVKRKFSLSPAHSFTLIELLVVIAIIAILAAILLPALNSARERGRSASCINNLKNIATATMQYADANEDFFPRQKMVIPSYGTSNVLTAGILTYHNYTDINVFFCPTGMSMMQTAKINEANKVIAEKNHAMLHNYASYGINAYACGDPSTDPSLKTGRFKNPSQSIIFGDSAVTDDNSTTSASVNVIQGCYLIQKAGATYKWGALYDYHNNKSSANLSWADGHVSNMQDARKTVHDGTDKYLHPDGEL